MTILNVAYPFAPVSLDAIGGAEQILAMIDRGLVASGMESIVLAAQGSRTSGALYDLAVSSTIDNQTRARTYEAYVATIAKALSDRKIDLVHMHGVDFSQYIPSTELPMLVTLHLPLEYYSESALTPRDHTVFNAVSEWQWRRCPQHIRTELVANGIDINQLYPLPEKENFVFVLGRICPEKGFHLALDAAVLSGMSCIVAGLVYGYAEHQRYFNEQILPRLDSKRRFIGPVGGALKRRLLAAAKCVLIPSLVAETSSLVAMEALASGTPVIAFRSGALVEIVSNEMTGFLVSHIDEMAGAIRRVDQIDPRECRRDACNRFSSEVMVSKYLRLYKLLIEGERPLH